MDTLAPIVLFTYNRPWHTKQTIEALQKNKLAPESEFFVYSDGSDNENSRQKVQQVRDYLQTIQGFKKITLIFHDCNHGLAHNIINGVTQIVQKYNKIIVLEDDIVTSPGFLTFMNSALQFYADEKRVWHISGWNYPIDTTGLNDTYVWRNMNCWGWATWADRWQHYEKEPKKLLESFHKGDIHYFNLDGSVDFWAQVINNYKGSMHTWAIFWTATIYKHNGLCLNPARSFVCNIGFDGTGTHTGIRTNYNTTCNTKENITFETEIAENKLALYRIKQFYLSQKGNNSLTFSKYLSKIKNHILSLDPNRRYIIYGAGSGAELVLTFINNSLVDTIIDKNPALKHQRLSDIEIRQPSFLTQHYDKQFILITVFGRSELIADELIDTCRIPRDKIVSLDIL